jgi:hypothetical protein
MSLDGLSQARAKVDLLVHHASHQQDLLQILFFTFVRALSSDESSNDVFSRLKAELLMAIISER